MSATCYVQKADGTLLGPMQREAVEMMKAAGMLPEDCCILDEKPQEKPSSFSRLLACVHQDDIAGFIALLKEGVSPVEKGPDGFSIAEWVRKENKTLFINCLDLLNLQHEQTTLVPVCSVASNASVADCSRIISDKQKELIQCAVQCMDDEDSTQEMKIRQLTEELLASGWEVNSELSEPGGDTTFAIFHIALKMCDVSFADRLLQSGAKVIPHPNGTYVVNPLEEVLHNPELLKLLLECPSVRIDDAKFYFCSFQIPREAAGMLAERGWHQTGLLLYAARCGWEDLVRAFIANGADVNAFGRASHTCPLQEAASAGHIEVVKILLQNGADWTVVDAKWREEWLRGRSWLYPDVRQYIVEFMSRREIFHAIEEADDAAFERLINSGADVYVLNERGENTLQVAQRLKNQRIEQMIRMICEAEIRPIESGCARSLVERPAIARIKDILLYGKPGNEEICLSLIDSVEVYDSALIDEIFEAAAEKNYSILIKKIIDNERKKRNTIEHEGLRAEMLNEVDNWCYRALRAAVRFGNVEACESWLEGMTLSPLNIEHLLVTSIECGCPQVFRCMWENIRGDIHESEELISRTIRYNQPEILDILMGYGSRFNIKPLPDCYIHSGVLRILLNRGVSLPINELCDVEIAEGNAERMPLCIAANEGDDECVRLLLDAGAKVELSGVMGRTALHYAAYRASARKVQHLIQTGADVNAEDERGYTPLHLAVLVGDEACTRLLLEAGSNADAGTLDGFTPLHLAANQGRADIAELLLRHGAERNPVNGMGISARSLAEKAGYDALVRLLA